MVLGTSTHRPWGPLSCIRRIAGYAIAQSLIPTGMAPLYLYDIYLPIVTGEYLQSNDTRIPLGGEVSTSRAGHIYVPEPAPMGWISLNATPIGPGLRVKDKFKSEGVIAGNGGSADTWVSRPNPALTTMTRLIWQYCLPATRYSSRAS